MEDDPTGASSDPIGTTDLRKGFPFPHGPAQSKNLELFKFYLVESSTAPCVQGAQVPQYTVGSIA